MCQILFQRFGSKDQLKSVLENSQDLYRQDLKIKGGQQYSFTFIGYTKIDDIVAMNTHTSDSINTLLEQIEFQIDYYSIFFIAFSRQIPEMENTSNLIPPFTSKNKNNPDELIWMHGTIYNDQEIAVENNVSFDVDSEAIAFRDSHDLKGVYTYLAISPNGKFEIVNEGQGLWLYPASKNEYGIDTYAVTDYLISSTAIDKNGILTSEFSNIFVSPPPQKIAFYTAFSGGMDISLSVWSTLEDTFIHFPNIEVNLNLIYFNYGTTAKEEEIKAISRFSDLVKKNFPNVEITTKVIDVKDLFKNLMAITTSSKLIEAGATGDSKETEANLAYVPYRNTIFASILGGLIDEDPKATSEDTLLGVILGLNLSDGSVYGDNSAYWRESMETVIKSGGKKFKNLDLISPYVYDTKTVMLEKFKNEYGQDRLEEVLDASYSCYYPNEDGSKCGKCGSCILREKAIQRSSNDG